jgi:hypothetical protein
MSNSFPQLKPHDPDGTRLRTIKVLLDPGDALLLATSLVPVNKLGAEIIGGDFTIEVIEMGLIAASANGDIWGVNYRLHGGADRVDEEPLPLIRLRPWLASQPDAPAYDQTFRVAIKQT